MQTKLFAVRLTRSPGRHRLKAVLLAVVAPFLVHGTASAQFIWDPQQTTTGSDGLGSWNTTSTLWSNGATNTTWVNSITSTATFGVGLGTAGVVSVADGITAGSITFNQPLAGSYTLNGGTLILGGATTVTTNAPATIGATINASGGVFTKAGSGTLTLNGTLGNVSSLQISSGTLVAGSGATLGGAGTAINVANGAKFQAASNVISNPLIFNGGSGDVASISGATLAGAVVLASGSNSFSSTVASTVSGTISGTGGLVKNGSQRLALTGVNTYTGTTTISNGNLTVGNGGTSGSLGTGAVVNNAQLAFNRSDAFTVANAISGTGAVTKAGTGTMTLTGASTYTGSTIVSGGKLLINGSLTGATGTSNSQVIVAAGAQLGGTGTVVGATAGAVTLLAGGQFSPGDFGSAGTFNATSLNWTSDSATAGMVFDLGATSATSDLLVLTGAFTRASTAASYIFDFNQTGALGQTYTLIAFGTALTGTAASVSNLVATDLPNGYSGVFALNGNNVVFTVVPEASTNALCILSGTVLAALAMRRRKLAAAQIL